jgi:hypothetical protein
MSSSIHLAAQNSLSPFLFSYPIPRFCLVACELVDHFSFVQRQPALAGGGLEKMAVVGHVQLGAEPHVPGIGHPLA